MLKKNRLTLFFTLLSAIVMLFSFGITVSAEELDAVTEGTEVAAPSAPADTEEPTESDPPVTDAPAEDSPEETPEEELPEAGTPPEEDLQTPETEAPPSDDAENTDEPAEDSSYQTIFTRLWEYVQTYCNELLSALSLLITAIFAYIYKKGKNSIVLGIGKVLNGQKGVITASDDSAAATKQMLENQAEMKQYYEEYAKNEQERNKVVSALLVEVMSLIEIQHITCLNNANMPQAIKDLVTSMHARCISSINDDAGLKAAYDEMRNTLGIGTSEVKKNEKENS